MPSEVETGPTTDELEEVNASALPRQLAETPEVAAFTQEEINAIHRFLGRIMPTPGTGFRSTAPDLARQLHGIIQKYVNNLVHRRFEEAGFNPNRP